jgi:transposase
VTTPTQVRESIIRAFHERGLSYEAIADLLGVGRATVSRVLRRHREAGTVEPRPRGGGNVSPIRGKAAERLGALLANRPDLTIAEMAAELERVAKIQTSPSSVGRALARLGYTRKKRASSPSSETRRRT